MEEFLYTITKDEINESPLGCFEGDIVIVEDDEALTEAVEYLSNFDRIGFDTESRPSFRRGEHHPVAIIQLAVEKRAYLIRVQSIEKIHLLDRVMGNEEIAKIGLGLLRDRSEIYDELGITCNNLVDLEKIAQRCKFQQRGVRALASFFLNMRISKSAQKTNWERPDLTESQIRYAATDAWVCLKIFAKMIDKGFVEYQNGKLRVNVPDCEDEKS